MNTVADKRRFHRFTVPVLVEVPELSELPLVPEDVSAGGLCLLLWNRPPEDTRILCTIQILGEVFEDCEASVAWLRENPTQPPSWTAGLTFRNLDSGTPRLSAALERARSMLG
jgi:hypothetical protein